MAYYVLPRLQKWGGHVPRVPHQIAPMPTTIVLHEQHRNKNDRFVTL